MKCCAVHEIIQRVSFYLLRLYANHAKSVSESKIAALADRFVRGVDDGIARSERIYRNASPALNA